MTESHESWEDRLLESALREKLAGEVPPDQSQPLHERMADVSPAGGPSKTPVTAPPWTRLITATVAVSLLLTVTVVLRGWRDPALRTATPGPTSGDAAREVDEAASPEFTSGLSRHEARELGGERALAIRGDVEFYDAIDSFNGVDDETPGIGLDRSLALSERDGDRYGVDGGLAGDQLGFGGRGFGGTPSDEPGTDSLHEFALDLPGEPGMTPATPSIGAGIDLDMNVPRILVGGVDSSGGAADRGVEGLLTGPEELLAHQGRPAGRSELDGESGAAEGELREGDDGRVDAAEQPPATAETVESGRRRERSNETPAADSATRDRFAGRTWRRASAIANAARLVVGDRDELLPEGLDVQVTVDGFVARVVLDYYFRNDRGRQLEGNFLLRLPDESSLFYFAFGETVMESDSVPKRLPPSAGAIPQIDPGTGALLRLERDDTWQGVKEARLVERQRAAYAYHETTRRRVDPALVEWAGAGIFQARVFPLAPGQLHRIVIGYDVLLQRDGDDWVYRLDLPPDRGQCHVDVSCTAWGDTLEEIVPPAEPLEIDRRRFYHYAEPVDDQIVVRQTAYDGLVLTGSLDDHDYFATRCVLDELPEAPSAGGRRAIFLLDTSVSSQPDRFQVWLNLMREILDANRETMREFAVLTFDVDGSWWREEYTPNEPEHVEELMASLHERVLEGATDLGRALQMAARPAWAGDRDGDAPDLFLFSDGLGTWGFNDLATLQRTLDEGHVNGLFAYRVQQGGSTSPLLDALAGYTGGSVFTLGSEDELPELAVAHRQRPWQLIRVDVPATRDLLVAGQPRTVYPGQRLLLVGKGRPEPGTVMEFTLTRDGEERRLSIPVSWVLDSRLAPRTYGTQAVAYLEDVRAVKRDEAVAFARHFRVTGRTCSLLMLESEADYERFEIRPEDDAFVVEQIDAGITAREGAEAISRESAGAKQAMLAWIEQLDDAPGMPFEWSTATRIAVEGMPEEAFRVERSPSSARLVSWEQLPSGYAEALRAAGEMPLEEEIVVREAERRLRDLGTADAVRSVSSLIELNPGDMRLTWDVATMAVMWDRPDEAYVLLQRVARSRPFLPQPYLALARCAAQLERNDLALVWYEIVLSAQWPGNYGEVHRIAQTEYLQLLHEMVAGSREGHATQFAASRLARLREGLQFDKCDLVVTVIWSTNRTDVDLHVIEPSGERCYFQHNTTVSGARLTSDVTQGFGPEMYFLPNSPGGDYQVLLNYYGEDAARTGTRTRAWVTIHRGLGTDRHDVEQSLVTLTRAEETREVTRVTVE